MEQAILRVPHDTLRKKSLAFKNIHSDESQTLISNLKDSLINSYIPGAGLSFPQIGHNLRGFVTYLDNKMRTYLNPEILDYDEKMTLGGRPDRPMLEGCLSIPHIWGPIWRSKKIKIRALDDHGVEFTRTLTSFPARLFMHELDHLEGILFTDYTLRDDLPLYFLDREADKFTEIKDPTQVIKW